MLSITNVVRGLFARSATPQRPRREPRRLRIECLEERTLLCNPGELDVTFGNAGVVRTDIGYVMAIQSDGRIISGGGTSTARYDKDFALERHNTNGGLDTSFGNGGTVSTNFPKIQGNPSWDEIAAIAIQTDGKILAVGTTGVCCLQSSSSFAIARYNPNGSLDKSFGSKGLVKTDILGSTDHAAAVAIQPDGKFVVVGASDANCCTQSIFAVVRYLPNGSLDTTFDGDGKLTINVGQSSANDAASSVAIQADGKIVVGGSAGGDFAIVRLNTNGSLDSSFGASGQVITDVSSKSDSVASLAILSDQRIIVAGTSGYDPNSENTLFALARYNPNGSLDTSFGANGIVTTEIGLGQDNAHDIGIQSDGKIVVAGSSHNGVNFDFAVVRYNTDGSLDSSFGSGGIVTSAFGPGSDTAWSLAIQTDDRIVVAGSSYNGTNYDAVLVRYCG